MVFAPLAATPFWLAVTRLGEAQVMLPAVAASLAWLALRANARPLVLWWGGTLALAAFLTTISKIAFIGYGVGVASLDFTGVSGHAMFATAVYPLLLRVLVASHPPPVRHTAVALGVLLAIVVGVSRLAVGAHSMSEIVAGWVLGGAASAAALAMARQPSLRLPAWLPLLVAGLLIGLGTAAPPSRSHDMVTRLSLAISGRSTPYTRHDLYRAPAAAAAQQVSMR